MDTSHFILGAAVIAGLYMAWSIGANDVANAMGTSVGSHALTIRQAIFVAAIFEFIGALMVGQEVTNTIRHDIVNPESLNITKIAFAGGMTAALVATAVWLQFASSKGLPVSTTHSIIGAVVGFGIVAGNSVSVVNWGTLLEIVASWFISPLLGGIIAFSTFFLIRKYILDSKDPIGATKLISPMMLFMAVFSVLFMFLVKSKIFGTDVFETGLIAAVLSGAIGIFARALMSRGDDSKLDRDEQLAKVERIFAWLQVVTACFMALAHGSNDVANAIGPVAAVVSIVEPAWLMSLGEDWWLMVLTGLGGFGIVIGLATYGKKVIETVGKGITEITPTRGFAAEFGAASIILVGSSFGLPLSTTQVLVGAVIGVGLARGIAGLNLAVIRKITGSWIFTIPTTGLVSAALSYAWLSIYAIL